MNFTLPSTVQTILLSILVAFVVTFLWKLFLLLESYVMAKLPVEKRALLKSYAVTMVKNLEQAPQFASYDKSDKKQYALLYVLNAAEQAGYQVLETAAVSAANAVGLTITKKDIDAIVEEAVSDVKTKINVAVAPVVVPAVPTPAV